MTNHEDLKAKYRADNARKPMVKEAARLSEQTQRLQRFENAHPAIAAWWKDAERNTFAYSLRSSVMAYGSLTEKQMAAANAASSRETSAPAMDIARIEHVFAVALKNGVQRPKLRLGGVVFGLGRPGSQYENTIFVNDPDRTYLGRVSGGKFLKGALCPPERAAEILKLGEDPLAAAVAYGRVTGQCAVCGRVLENADSIARGIGPVCAERMGWAG